jgi:phytoene dehydrogenase-like protein
MAFKLLAYFKWILQPRTLIPSPQSPAPMSYDIIIIGAGMSGLAAGIRCAHYGKKVAILERHTTIGGLNSFYRLRQRNYDVGLHAVTNFTPKGTKKGPLARLLRQLRFAWEDFELAPQRGSRVAFPNTTLDFSNDPALLRDEVARAFPKQIDNYDRLVASLIDYDDLNPAAAAQSAREVLQTFITDPLLIEMLFCPLMFYGSAREGDMDWGQFCIMFRSVLLEGFARPYDGVRVILKQLTRRYKELGGELKLRAGVSKILERDGTVYGVQLDSGEELLANQVLSSAGWHETLRLCDAQDKVSSQQSPPGLLTFIESISILNCQPSSLGYDQTIVFFNDSDTFHYARPRDELADVRSGVICSPNNYQYPEGELPEGVMRITALADFDRWAALDPEAYQAAKSEWYERMIASAVRFVPDFRAQTIETDMFTPTTIRRFTWHDYGAVYGMPEKRTDGTTPYQNLYICGTDQGWVGIIGSMMSGAMMANVHLLK